MKKKGIKVLILIVTLFVIILLSTSFAAVAVTEENLKAALLSFQSSEANEEGYAITMANNIMSITLEGENYNLSYDISGEKPTFTYEVPIQKGMSYEEYNKKCGDTLMLPMICYIGVANIQGVGLEDATTYFAFSYLSGALGGGFTTDENTYVIMDDMNLSDGVTINKDESSPNTIYTSEFGDRVIEYVNALYKEKQTIQDTTGINSYVMTIERKDVTETSCKIVSTLSVNLDADFSKIKGTAEGLEDSFSSNTGITKDNADYVIELKVGQKCKLKSMQEITGYETYGGSCIEFSEDRTEITGKKQGDSQGYIYVGDTKKSIYIIVEENTSNSVLQTITFDLDKNEIVNTDDDENIKNEDEDKNIIQDKEDTSSDLPQTGLNNFILIISIMLGIIVIVLYGIKIRKYKDVK